MAAQMLVFPVGIQIIQHASATAHALWAYLQTTQLVVASQNAHLLPISLVIKKFVTSHALQTQSMPKTILVNVYRFVLMVVLPINIILDVWMYVHLNNILTLM